MNGRMMVVTKPSKHSATQEFLFFFNIFLTLMIHPCISTPVRSAPVETPVKKNSKFKLRWKKITPVKKIRFL